MKILNRTHLLALAGGTLLALTACKKDKEELAPLPDTTSSFTITDIGNNTNKVEGSTAANFTFSSDKQWLLQSFVYVEDGATLTIEPGTIIKGDKNSKGTLIIKRGAKINAVGSASQPIVFTSNQPAGSRDYGDWGGLIICGRAGNNQPGGEARIEGGPDAYYGGGSNPNDADNSGTMRYVRIEFPGIAFQPDQEINGLTLGAVGSGTTLDHIQVSYSGDDSYEMFGGAVNLKHIVAFRGWDDDFDTDNGYRGKVQFALALRDPNIADQSGSNGFESDNDASGSSASPLTRPVFSNVSILGPGTVTGSMNGQFKRAAHIRRNSRLNAFNTVLAGYPTGLLIDGSLTEGAATNNDLQFRTSIIAGCSTPLAVASGSTFDASAWFNTSGWGNSVLANISELGLNTPFSLNAPALLPNGGSPLLSGAAFSNPALMDGFFQQVSFLGAFGTEDWTQGWCNWDPQNTPY